MKCLSAATAHEYPGRRARYSDALAHVLQSPAPRKVGSSELLFALTTLKSNIAFHVFINFRSCKCHRHPTRALIFEADQRRIVSSTASPSLRVMFRSSQQLCLRHLHPHCRAAPSPYKRTGVSALKRARLSSIGNEASKRPPHGSCIREDAVEQCYGRAPSVLHTTDTTSRSSKCGALTHSTRGARGERILHVIVLLSVLCELLLLLRCIALRRHVGCQKAALALRISCALAQILSRCMHVEAAAIGA